MRLDGTSFLFATRAFDVGFARYVTVTFTGQTGKERSTALLSYDILVDLGLDVSRSVTY
jgi:hypothetical protein